MSRLPSGWAEAKLVTIADVVRGVTYSKKDARANADDGYLPILRATNIGDRLSLDSEMVYVPESCVRPDQRMLPGDILIAASSGSARVVGKSAQLGAQWDGGFGAFCSVVRPHQGIDPKYLGHFVASPQVRKSWRALAQGTNINNLKSSHLADTCVPIAPIQEQERIVAAIDEHLSRIEVGTVAVRRAERNLKRMRAAIYLDLDSRAEESSARVPLRDVAEFIVDGDHNPPKRVAAGIPYLTAKHVKKGRVSAEGATFVSESDYAVLRRRYQPRGGDVLITCVGTLGEIAIVPDGLVFAADRNLAVVRPSTVLLPGYLEAILRSPRQQGILTRGSGATAQPHLYLKDLRELPIPAPPIELQRTLMVALQTALARIDHVEESLRAMSGRTRGLRASLLIAAFSGILVKQNGNDEPAAKLLERIAGACPPSGTPVATARSVRRNRAAA